MSAGRDRNVRARSAIVMLPRDSLALRARTSRSRSVLIARIPKESLLAGLGYRLSCVHDEFESAQNFLESRREFSFVWTGLMSELLRVEEISRKSKFSTNLVLV